MSSRVVLNYSFTNFKSLDLGGIFSKKNTTWRQKDKKFPMIMKRGDFDPTSFIKR